MTYTEMKNVYDSLCTNTALTNVVPSTSIRIGVLSDEDPTFPAISIRQAGGRQVGRLGHGSSGETMEDTTLQIDVYSRTSVMQAYQIVDLLDNIMISSTYRKDSDLDIWEDEFQAHRKATRWSKFRII